MIDPEVVLNDRKASNFALRTALAAALGKPLPDFLVSGKLFDRCRRAFIEEYESCTGLPYHFGAKDGKALQSVIDQLQAILTGDRGDEAVFNGFCFLVANLPQWYRDNQFNLNVIDCKFNDIVRTIKNERNGNGRNNGLGDDYKRELLASLQATR